MAFEIASAQPVLKIFFMNRYVSLAETSPNLHLNVIADVEDMPIQTPLLMYFSKKNVACYVQLPCAGVILLSINIFMWFIQR